MYFWYIILYTYQFVLLIAYVNNVKFEIKIVQPDPSTGFFDGCQVFEWTAGGSSATYVMQVKEEEQTTPTWSFFRKFWID